MTAEINNKKNYAVNKEANVVEIHGKRVSIKDIEAIYHELHYDFLPPTPFSQEAESAVLGSLLVTSRRYAEVAEFLRCDDFFFIANRWVWEAMERLHKRGDNVDYLTVIEELRIQDRLETIGGLAYITGLVNECADTNNVVVYAHIVERAAIRRRLVDASQEIIRIATTDESDIHEIIEKSDEELCKITSRRIDNRMRSLTHGLSDFYDYAEKAIINDGAPMGILTGFADLDNLLGGFQDSDLTIIAGRPGMGKTALLLNLATSIAKANKKAVFFSLEMSELQLVTRMISHEARIDSQKLRQGKIEDEDFTKILAAIDTLSRAKMHIDDSASLTVNQILNKCRALKKREGLDIVFVDYLQKLGTSNNKADRHEIVRQFAEGLKNLAKELQVPVVAAAQLNRACEQRMDRRPILSDLAESGNIEREADIVSFIYRDGFYNPNSECPNITDVIIAKHRNGPTGTIQLYFQKEFTGFASVKHEKIDLVDF